VRSFGRLKMSPANPLLACRLWCHGPEILRPFPCAFKEATYARILDADFRERLPSRTLCE
jgi:hypothetical protein